MRVLPPEMARILALTRPVALPAADAGVPLRPAQAEALGEWSRALRSPDTAYGPPGLAVLAGVGHGKTLIALLLPHVHAAVLGRTPKTLYLVPAALRDQLQSDRAMWATAGARVPLALEVLSHESLSSPRGKDAIRDVAPELLVIDEAHHFADPRSARWRRVAAYLRLRPETRLAILSGSLSWRSLRQCRHLLLASLRGWCPLPCNAELDNWAACVDVGSEPSGDDLRALAPLVDAHAPAHRTSPPTPAAVRTAYRARLATCPGVVLTTSPSCDASLRIVAWPGPTPPPVVAAAVSALEETWVLPDGTELVSSLEYARHGAAIPLGFFQRYAPETVDPAYLAARSDWARCVRNAVAFKGHRYQSPSAYVHAAERGDLDGSADGRIYAAWAALEDQDPPTTETVWYADVDGPPGTWAARVVRAWAKSSAAPRLVWVQTPTLGLALAAALGVRYRGAGSVPPTGASCIVSSRVHGTGWSGAPAAGYRETLVLEPPSSGATWEQLLGRTHRAGQTEDVTCHVYCPSQRGFGALSKGVADARYVEETTGQRQRLLRADWTGYAPSRAPRPPRPTDATTRPPDRRIT